MEKRIFRGPIPEELAEFLINRAERCNNQSLIVYPQGNDSATCPRAQRYTPSKMYQLRIPSDTLKQRIVEAASVIVEES